MQPFGLYCNRRGLEAGSNVLQYTALCCNLGARQGWTVLQYSAQPSHDTTTVATTRPAGAGLGARHGRWHAARVRSKSRQALGRQARRRERAYERERERGHGRKHGRRASRGARSAGGQAAAHPAGAGGAQAWVRGARGLGVPVRAGWSAGPSWCTVHLAQF